MLKVSFSINIYFLSQIIYFISIINLIYTISEHRIINGENVKSIEDFNYQAQLEYHDNFICGAVIIKPLIVITAAHCTIEYTNYLRIRAGTLYRENNGELRNVTYIINHPKYNHNNKYINNYDISILWLDKSFIFTKNLNSIPLILNEPKINDNGIICGWGQLLENYPILSNILQYTNVKILDRKLCRSFYYQNSKLFLNRNNYLFNCYTKFCKIYIMDFIKKLPLNLIIELSDKQLCAGNFDGSSDGCKGDSGGALVINDKLAGISSWGIGCSRRGYPGVYTNIYQVKPFIEKYVDEL